MTLTESAAIEGFDQPMEDVLTSRGLEKEESFVRKDEKDVVDVFR